MRELDSDGLRRLAISITEEVAETNPGRITILSRQHPEEPFTRAVLVIQVCGKETHSRWHDVDEEMERLRIHLRKAITVSRIPDSEKEYIKRVVNGLKNSTGFLVSPCVKVLKRLSDHEAIIKLFDRHFLLRSLSWIPDHEDFRYIWLGPCNEKGFFDPTMRLYELDREEMFTLLL